MRIGMTVGLGLRSESTMDSLASRVEALAAQGFATVWMPCGSGFDPLTALPVAGRATAGIELGTAIMPTWPRHPAALAQQALTADDALRGRLTLGIGASHEVMMSHDLGIPFEQPARHTREYLSVLGPLLASEPACFRGEVFSVETQLLIRRGARVVPVLLAAMGPAMLRLAGAATTGTITSWTGPRTIADFIVPAISAAAQAAARPAPRIVVGLPIGLTADPDGLRPGSPARRISTSPCRRIRPPGTGRASPPSLTWPSSAMRPTWTRPWPGWRTAAPPTSPPSCSRWTRARPRGPPSSWPAGRPPAWPG